MLQLLQGSRKELSPGKEQFPKLSELGNACCAGKHSGRCRLPGHKHEVIN